MHGNGRLFKRSFFIHGKPKGQIYGIDNVLLFGKIGCAQFPIPVKRIPHSTAQADPNQIANSLETPQNVPTVLVDEDCVEVYILLLTCV